MSASSEPSIITLVKPWRIAERQVASSLPWSWCRQIGIARVHLGERLDHAAEHDVAGIGAGAAARLQDHRRVGRRGRAQDGKTLLHVVDVEGRHAVAVLGGMVEKLSEGDEGHGRFLGFSARRGGCAASATAWAVMPKWA